MDRVGAFEYFEDKSDLIGGDAASLKDVAADELEESLLAARRMIGEALVKHRTQQARDVALIEHHNSEQTLWPFFASFLRRARHRPMTVYATNTSWLSGGSSVPAAVARLREGMLSGCGELVILADNESTDYPDVAERLVDLEQRGATVRVHLADLADMLILDRSAVVLRMPDPQQRPDRTSLALIRVPEIVTAMRQMVTAVFAGAVDLNSFRRWLTIRDGLTGRVLFLLQMGYKDETAARMLDMSVRTYRRHVATLMEELGVTSRFQAGFRTSLLGTHDT
jgi:hypothetical protein